MLRQCFSQIADDLVLQELDFINEARNCEKCENNFKKLSPELASQIRLPHIFWEWSTSRVLTMEFMEGVNVTDVQAIKLLGLRPADVARLVSVISQFICLLFTERL